MRILYCHCAYARVVPPDVKQDVLRALAESEADFDAVPDLCEMSARRDPALQQIAEGGDTAIVACYPRAVKWLFHAAGAPLPDGVRVFNMRVQSANDIVSDLCEVVGAELPPPLARVSSELRRDLAVAPGAKAGASAPRGGDKLRPYDTEPS